MENKVTHIQLDDRLWERINRITRGAASVCYQCGECTAVCPWGMVREDPLNVRTMMRKAQLGIRDWNEDLWLCTSCTQCEAYCPRGVNISEVIRALRWISWQEGRTESGLPSMLWSIYWNDNPWSQPPMKRFKWANEMDVPIFNPQVHEVALFIGCTASYDRRVQRVTLDLVKVLQKFAVNFGCLGEKELCCGEPVKSVGHNAYFEEIVFTTARTIRDMGVEKLVTVSPHCYDVFKNHYPKWLNGEFIETYHYTQYIAQLMASGRKNLRSDSRSPVAGGEAIHHNHTQQIVTFQDPCYLGRRNNEYEAPRQVLQSLPGLVLEEMQNHKQEGLCCGGGGGRMWLDTPAGERFADVRIHEAAATGASIIATACPFCLVYLEDSLKASGLENMRVMDVAEIIWDFVE